MTGLWLVHCKGKIPAKGLRKIHFFKLLAHLEKPLVYIFISISKFFFLSGISLKLNLKKLSLKFRVINTLEEASYALFTSAKDPTDFSEKWQDQERE